MKKVLALTLVLVLALTAFVGCKKNEKTTPNLSYATQDYAKLAKMASKNLLRQLKRAQEGEVVETKAELIPSKICFDTSINKN